MNTISCPRCGYKNKAIYKYCSMCFERLHYIEHPKSITSEHTTRVANITKILFAVIIILIALILAKFGLIRF
ncbi:MAG: hypothetical protein QME68_01095 [Elusimicrobiota bacterium]|nr:hypothetical protein [Elusimicrobiota bacterium]